MPMPDDFEQMWADLAPVGRSRRAAAATSASPSPSAERELRAWFVEQCARPRPATSSPTASATWSPGGIRARRVPSRGRRRSTGSHLDSVLDGGAYDGPLGVVSALAAVDLLRERGVRARAGRSGCRCFVEEEGSRFGLACLGSRLATGATTPDAGARAARPGRRTRSRTRWPPPGSSRRSAGPGWLDGVGCFVELHVEQGRDLVDRDAAVGVASGIWPHGRYRFDFTGEANHAGTTRMEDRHDPMLTYAMTALAANKQARLAGQRATFGRVDVAPNGTNAVPSRVTAWLDARCDVRRGARPTLVDAIERQAHERAGRDGTSLDGHRRVGVGRGRLRPGPGRAARRRPRGGDWPVIPTEAGHDAGILSARGHPDARCCSSATRPASRTRRPSTPRWPTAWPASRRSPTPWSGWRVTSYLLEHAPGSTAAVRDDVLVEIEDGRFTPSTRRAILALAGVATPTSARIPG